MIWVDGAKQIELVPSIEVCAAPLTIGMVLVLGKLRQSSSVVKEVGEGVLCPTRKPMAEVSPKREIECIHQSAASGFDVLNLAVPRIGARVIRTEFRVWRKNGGIDIDRTEGLDLNLSAIFSCQRCLFPDPTLESSTVLNRIRRTNMRGELDEIGGKTIQFWTRR